MVFFSNCNQIQKPAFNEILFINCLVPLRKSFQFLRVNAELVLSDHFLNSFLQLLRVFIEDALRFEDLLNVIALFDDNL